MMRTDQSENFCKNCYVQKIHNLHSDYCVGCLVINKELGKYVCYEFVANTIAGSCMGCWKKYNINNHWKSYNIKNAKFVVCESCDDRLWKFSTEYKKLNEGSLSTYNQSEQMAEFKPKRETASSRIIEQLDQVMCTVQDVANEVEIVKKQTCDDMQPRTQMLETHMIAMHENILEILRKQRCMQVQIDQIQNTQTNLYEDMIEDNDTQTLRVEEFRDKYDNIMSRTKAIEYEIKASRQKTIFHIESKAAEARVDIDDLKDLVIELDMPALVEADPDSSESSDDDMPSLVDSSESSEDTPLTTINSFDSGNKIVYTVDEFGVRQGLYTIYNLTGICIEQRNYIDGDMCGEYYKRVIGEKDFITKGYYIAGKKTGIWTYLEGVGENQRFLSEQTFLNDKPHGPCKGDFNNQFYNEKFEGRYDNGWKTGKWTFWQQSVDGIEYVSSTRYYHQGKMQGPFTIYNSNGIVISEHMYVDNERV